MQTIKSTEKNIYSLELSYNSYCTLPKSNILLLFSLKFIGCIRCTVLSYNHIELKLIFNFLRFPKKNTIGLILSNFIVFLEKPYFLKVRWFNSTSCKNNFLRFEYYHLLL